jgi:hypothetical protein
MYEGRIGVFQTGSEKGLRSTLVDFSPNKKGASK